MIQNNRFSIIIVLLHGLILSGIIAGPLSKKKDKYPNGHKKTGIRGNLRNITDRLKDIQTRLQIWMIRSLEGKMLLYQATKYRHRSGTMVLYPSQEIG